MASSAYLWVYTTGMSVAHTSIRLHHLYVSTQPTCLLHLYMYILCIYVYSTSTCLSHLYMYTLTLHTVWRRLIGCLKLQVMFRKRAINYWALLRKMIYEIRHPMRLHQPVSNPVSNTRGIRDHLVRTCIAFLFFSHHNCSSLQVAGQSSYSFILDTLQKAKKDNYLGPRVAATLLGKPYVLLVTRVYFESSDAASGAACITAISIASLYIYIRLSLVK